MKKLLNSTISSISSIVDCENDQKCEQKIHLVKIEKTIAFFDGQMTFGSDILVNFTEMQKIKKNFIAKEVDYILILTLLICICWIINSFSNIFEFCKGIVGEFKCKIR